MRLTRPAFAVLLMCLLLSNSTSSRFVKLAATTTAVPPSLVPAVTNSAALYEAWELGTSGLSKEAFENAYKGYEFLQSKCLLKVTNLLTIVDYSMSSSQKRLFVLDMAGGKVLFNSLVAHGRNSGLEQAKDFSNAGESHKTSLGFYITKDTYRGGNGYSLKLQGCERGINDNAQKRAIVIHGADYVSAQFIRRNGYLGRSHGCPALPMEMNKKIIDVIKGGSCLFLYYPSKTYINRSKILNS